MSGMSSPQNQSPARSSRGLMNEPAVRVFVGARLPANRPVHPTRFYRLDNFSRASALLQGPRFIRRFAAPNRRRRSNANQANQENVRLEYPQNESPARSARGLMDEPSVRASVGARLPANRPVHPTHFCRLDNFSRASALLQGPLSANALRCWPDAATPARCSLIHPAGQATHHAGECTVTKSICRSALAREQAGTSDTFL